MFVFELTPHKLIATKRLTQCIVLTVENFITNKDILIIAVSAKTKLYVAARLKLLLSHKNPKTTLLTKKLAPRIKLLEGISSWHLPPSLLSVMLTETNFFNLI